MTRNEEILKLKEEGKTLEFIGKKFDITKERVRQICVKAGMRYTRSHKVDDNATLNALKAKSTYPSNLVCVNEDGHMVFISDGNNQWVQVHNKKLKEAIREIYSLQSWIEI
jgi:hypothetical protein